MNLRHVITLAWISTTALMVGCSKSNPAGPSDSSNLVENPSFETDGSPSLKGWSIVSGDADLVSFSNDVPSGGGKYLLTLAATWGPSSRVGGVAPAFPGMHKYEFSVWAKREDVGGSIRFYFKPKASPWFFQRSLMITDTVWTRYSFADSAQAAVGDSLVLAISGGLSDTLSGRTFYDLCSVQRID